MSSVPVRTPIPHRQPCPPAHHSPPCAFACPRRPRRHIIDARLLSWLPAGASVINAARGGHLAEPDLLAALDSGHVSASLLVVFVVLPVCLLWRPPKAELPCPRRCWAAGRAAAVQPPPLVREPPRLHPRSRPFPQTTIKQQDYQASPGPGPRPPAVCHSWPLPSWTCLTPSLCPPPPACGPIPASASSRTSPP